MKKQKLFILHFAGGNKYSFQPIIRSFERFDYEVLELPGRGKRMGEKLLYSQKEAVDDLYAQIQQKYQEDNFLIYGHSMGASLGLRLCSKLIRNQMHPKALFVTGNPGPGVTREEKRYDLPKPEFIEELRKLGGIPEEVYESDELFGFFEPILRADFQVVELGDNELTPPVNIPIYAVMGEAEKYADQIDNWRKYTTADFSSEVWEGNHFFIMENGDRLADRIELLAKR